MQLLLKILLPVIIFVTAIFAAKTIRENAPEARKRPPVERVRAVEASKYEQGKYQITLASRGTIRPSRRIALVPEITGSVKSVSSNFVTGGRFEAGEVLVAFDQRDYEIALTQARANVAQADATLQQERARSQQSVADWKSLGRTGSPSALTARLPQVAAARAALSSANAQVQRAELDLSRTQIIAPFDGRVEQAGVTTGEFVARGAALGSIYAIDDMEIRLPVSSTDLEYLIFPPDPALAKASANVILSAQDASGQMSQWSATLMRSEGINAATQQAHVIARVDLQADTNGSTVRVGQYVSAEIQAAMLSDVFVIPRSAIREGREIVLVDEEQTLQPTSVAVRWTDDQFAAIATEGLPKNPVIVTTVLGTVLPGMKVRATIDGEANPDSSPGKRNNRKEKPDDSTAAVADGVDK